MQMQKQKLWEKYFTVNQFQSFLWGSLRWLFQSLNLPWLNENFAIVVSKEHYLKTFPLYFTIIYPSEQFVQQFTGIRQMQQHVKASGKYNTRTHICL